MRKRAEAAWAKKLGTIEVQGGTEKERMLFYSNLYHSFASPRLVRTKGRPVPRTRRTDEDGSITTATAPYRSGTLDAINSFSSYHWSSPSQRRYSKLHARDGKRDGYMQTSFHGDHAVWMYLGDWQRGLSSIGRRRMSICERMPWILWSAPQSCRVSSERLGLRHRC